MDEETKEELDELNRAEQKRAVHKERQKEAAAEERAMHANYQQIKEEPAFLDLVDKINRFIDLHTTLAEDGVGSRSVVRDGRSSYEEYYLTPDQVARELGGSAALKQLKTYIERKLA